MSALVVDDAVRRLNKVIKRNMFSNPGQVSSWVYYTQVAPDKTLSVVGLQTFN